MTQATGFAVICCRPDPADPAPSGAQDRDGRAAADDRASRGALSEVLDGCAGSPLHWVGRRPGKEIDPLLTG